jgi:hypothetical protein
VRRCGFTTGTREFVNDGTPLYTATIGVSNFAAVLGLVGCVIACGGGTLPATMHKRSYVLMAGTTELYFTGSVGSTTAGLVGERSTR